MDISDIFGRYIIENNRLHSLEEFEINNGETQTLVNAKLFLDINKNIEYIKTKLKD